MCYIDPTGHFRFSWVEAMHHVQQRRFATVDYLLESKINWLLIFIPASLAARLFGLPELDVFLASALGIVPLAALIGDATEELAHRTGPALGGLLNATFGNATELIIALFALRAGLQEVVKASITGSIIGNLLLVLGVAMLVGGWGRDRQIFNRTSAGAHASMLFLAVVALVMPAVFDLAVLGSLERSSAAIEALSLLVAVVLLAIYAASLLFSLKTHRELLTSVPEEVPRQPRLSLRGAVILLAVATGAVAFESELLVGSLDVAGRALGLSEFFVGIVVVAVVGNAAEHFSAILMARRNSMDLAVTIATGSSTQIALFVAPVLVLASFLMGQPLSLVFNAFEIGAVALAVIGLAIVSLDGESNWFEGLQLVAVYVVLAIVFYFVPAP